MTDIDIRTIRFDLGSIVVTEYDDVRTDRINIVVNQDKNNAEFVELDIDRIRKIVKIVVKHRRKMICDYAVPLDMRTEQLSAQHTGKSLSQWVELCGISPLTFEKAPKPKKIRTKKKVVTQELPLPKPKKKRQRPIKGDSFRCEDCMKTFSVKKCVEFDEGAMTCRMCAGIRRGLAENPIDAPAAQSGFAWFVLGVAPTTERKSRKTLLREIEKRGMKSLVRRIVIPTNKILVIGEDTRRLQNKRSMNGYLIVQLATEDDNIHSKLIEFFESPISYQSGCFGVMPYRTKVKASPFLSNGKPNKKYDDQLTEYLNWVPYRITQEEIETVLIQSDRKKAIAPRVVLEYKQGDSVMICKGQYSDIRGIVTSISGFDHDPQITIAYLILGVRQEITVSFDEVQLIPKHFTKNIK